MNFKPLGDRILVKQLAAEEKTKGGIILPETAKEKPHKAEVIAVGEGKKVGDKLQPVSLKAGDKVLYSKYAGTEVVIDQTEYLIIKEEDVLGIIG